MSNFDITKEQLESLMIFVAKQDARFCSWAIGILVKILEEHGKKDLEFLKEQGWGPWIED